MNRTIFTILKNSYCAVLIILLLQACSSQKKIAVDEEITILGLGDSITEGGPEFFSYLFPLDSMLSSSGYKTRFIGPRQSVQQGDTLHHAGYSGKTAEYLAKIIDSIYAAFPADIVLLHSGHNHFIEESPINGIVDAQKKIIQSIKKKNPGAAIFVAGVITAGKLPKYDYIPELNIAIRKMVTELNNSSVIFVDQQDQWDWNIYTIHDKVHPNRAGANRIASKWYTAMPKFLKTKS